MTNPSPTPGERRDVPFARASRSARPQNGATPEDEPRIAAFIWGGKTRPAPILPYGRWKGAA